MTRGAYMNVLVIGLGSMGKRRIRLMKEMYDDISIYGVDSREDRRVEAGEVFGIDCVESIEQAAEKFDIDAAFVCTAPLSHCAIITECLNRHWNVFTELNLVSDGYEENMALAKENDCKLFLSSTFFYREEISYIKQRVKENAKEWNYIYHIGQYLPDWHPWEAYKDFFVGDKRTNGCREIMAIELPWLCGTFGDVVDFHVISNKMSDLNINYNDNYLIQLVHKNGNKGVLVVDVVSPVAVRKLELYSEHKYIEWTGTPDSLKEYNAEQDSLQPVSLNEKEEHKEGYRAFVVENAYKNEIREFFDVVNNHKIPQYDFNQDMQILKLIDALENNI